MMMLSSLIISILPQLSLGLLTEELRQEILDLHNDLRSQVALGNTGPGCSESSNQPQAANMNKLAWSYNLERYAQEYSDKCVWGHSDSDTRQTTVCSYSDDAQYGTSYCGWIGENIAVGSADAVKFHDYSSYNGNDYGLAGQIQGWFDEYEDYSYSSNSGCGTTGHYTAMVWANTRFVGCGATYCPGGTTDSSGNVVSSYFTLYQVCQYASGGNWNGEYPYEEGSPASNCDADRTANTDTGLWYDFI